MAKIINKTSPEIIASRRHQGLNFISIVDRGIYFPKTVSFKSGIKEGKYMHFINDGMYWAFFINDDKDGFNISSDGKGAFMVNDRNLRRMFETSTKRKIGDRLFVTETKAKQGGSHLWEIYTETTVDVIVDRERRIKEQRKAVLNIKSKL